MNMESLVCIAVVSVLAEWATKPIARLMKCNRGLAEDLISLLRDAVLDVLHSGTTIASARSQENGDQIGLFSSGDPTALPA